MKLRTLLTATVAATLLSGAAYAAPVSILEPCQTLNVVSSTACVGAFLQSTGEPTEDELNDAMLGGYDDWTRVDNESSTFVEIASIGDPSGTWKLINPVTGKMYAISLKGSTQWAAYLLSGLQGTWSTEDLNTPSGNQPDLSNVVLFHRAGEIPPIPLPAAGWLLLAGVGGLVAMRRKKAA